MTSVFQAMKVSCDELGTLVWCTKHPAKCSLKSHLLWTKSELDSREILMGKAGTFAPFWIYCLVHFFWTLSTCLLAVCSIQPFSSVLSTYKLSAPPLH